MRRHFLLGLIAVLLATGLVIAGCGGGDEETTTTEQPATTEAENGGDMDGSVDAAALYTDNCASCHGQDGLGTGNNPAVMGTGLDAQTMRTQIEDGGGDMPAFGDTLSEEEITALVEYLQGGN